MNLDRESSILTAFVSIAESLTAGYDIVDLYTGLTAGCVHLLDITAAGLLLADARAVLHLMAASCEGTRELEIFQLQRREGPCLDCYRAGTPVLVADLGQEADRWPHFVPAATAAGFASVHALPMRLQDATLGTLGLFGTDPGALSEADLALGQALADVASLALVAGRAGADPETVNAELQSALTSRVIVEQAKGFLAHRGDISIDAAGAALRRYAHDRNQRLTDTAQAIISRDLPAQQVLDHARSTNVLPRHQ